MARLNDGTRMSSDHTRMVARECAVFMDDAGFTPGTILNLGAGSFPELRVWKHCFPDACMVVVDPKEIWPKAAEILGSWKKSSYVQAVVGDGSSPIASFCIRCRSMVCINPEVHKRRKKHLEFPMVTIDELVKDKPSPCFIWMDIEGSELNALNGATETLKKTEWICTELMDWTPRHARRVYWFLKKSGFRMKIRFHHDGLFHKPGKG